MATTTMKSTKSGSGSVINGIDTAKVAALAEGIKRNPREGIARFAVRTHWLGGAKSETVVRGWNLGGKFLPKGFTIPVDEPFELAGANTAANPQEYLMAAINACMMATYVAACSVNGITLESVEIETEGDIDLRGFLAIDARVPAGYEEVRQRVHIKGDAAPEKFRQIHEHVLKTSPNYFNLVRPIRMTPELVVE